MHSLYIIILEIDVKLICYFEQDFFPIILVDNIFFYSRNKNIFSSYVLFLSVKIKNNHLSFELSHCLVALFLRQADSTYFHVQPSFLYSI